MRNKLFPILAFVGALVLLGGSIAIIQYARNRPEAPASTMTELTKDNFEKEVLQSTLPVYIEFYAPNCKPCEAQAPIIEKVKADYAGKVKFVRVDGANQPEIAQAAGVSKVPAHLFIKPVEGIGMSAQGLLDEATLRKFIDQGLAMQPKPQPTP